MDLYYRNAGAVSNTPGLSLLPKLTFEHVILTSFSKMRVDLAAQVAKIEYLFILLNNYCVCVCVCEQNIYNYNLCHLNNLSLDIISFCRC